MTTAERLLEEAKALPPDELEWLAEQLWGYLDPEPPPLSPEWEAELERREQAVRAGTMPVSSAQDAMAFIRGERP